MGVMEAYQIGQETAPTASIGQAIRQVLDLHNKMTESSGMEMFKSAQPGARANAEQSLAAADYSRSGADVNRQLLEQMKAGVTFVEGEDPTTGKKRMYPVAPKGLNIETGGQGSTNDRNMTREKAVTMATAEADKNPQTATPGPRRDQFINSRTTQIEGILGGGAITTQTPPPPKPGFLNQLFNGPGQAMGNQIPVPQNMTPYAANKAGMPQYAATQPTRTQTGMTASPQAKRMTATNGTEQIYSDDGGVTWYNSTGKRVQ
jgi:hypothetical protein